MFRWFKDTFCTAPRMLPDVETAPKPVAPLGYYFEVTDNGQTLAEYWDSSNCQSMPVLLVTLMQDDEEGRRCIVAASGIYKRGPKDSTERRIRIAMEDCLFQLQEQERRNKEEQILKSFVGRYPPKKLSHDDHS